MLSNRALTPVLCLRPSESVGSTRHSGRVPVAQPFRHSLLALLNGVHADASTSRSPARAVIPDRGHIMCYVACARQCWRLRARAFPFARWRVARAGRWLETNTQSKQFRGTAAITSEDTGTGKCTRTGCRTNHTRPGTAGAEQCASSQSICGVRPVPVLRRFWHLSCWRESKAHTAQSGRTRLQRALGHFKQTAGHVRSQDARSNTVRVRVLACKNLRSSRLTFIHIRKKNAPHPARRGNYSIIHPALPFVPYGASFCQLISKKTPF